MVRALGILVLTLPTIGCGPGTSSTHAVDSGTGSGTGPSDGRGGTVPLADRCGEAAPVRLLELGAREAVAVTPPAVVHFDGGWLIGIQELDTDVTAQMELNSALRRDHEVATRIVAMGQCGEDPQVVVEGADWIFPPPSPGDPWTACHLFPDALYWFDPTGNRPAQRLTDRCPPAVFEGSIIAADVGTDGVENLMRFEADQHGKWNAHLLQPDVAAPVWVRPAPGGDPSDPHVVFALTADRKAVQIDLRTDDRRVLLDDVSFFGAAPGTGLLLWTPDGGLGSLSGQGGRWYLRTADGSSRPLGAAWWPQALVLWNGTAATATTGWDHPVTATELTFFSDLDTITLDGVWSVVGERPDRTRFLTGGYDELGRAYVLAPSEETPRRLSDASARRAWLDDGELWIAVSTGAEYDPSDPPTADMSRKIVRFVDDRTPQTVVEDVYHPVRSRGRWLTVRDQAPDYYGDLVAVDADGVAGLVDHDVFVEVARYNDTDVENDAPPTVDGPFVYLVRDEAGGRSGIWMAELAE